MAVFGFALVRAKVRTDEGGDPEGGESGGRPAREVSDRVAAAVVQRLRRPRLEPVDGGAREGFHLALENHVVADSLLDSRSRHGDARLEPDDQLGLVALSRSHAVLSRALVLARVPPARLRDEHRRPGHRQAARAENLSVRPLPGDGGGGEPADRTLQLRLLPLHHRQLGRRRVEDCHRGLHSQPHLFRDLVPNADNNLGRCSYLVIHLRSRLSYLTLVYGSVNLLNVSNLQLR